MEHLVDVKNSTNFPWLMSNVIDKKTDGPLGEGLVKVIIEWEGRKVKAHAHYTIYLYKLCWLLHKQGGYYVPSLHHECCKCIVMQRGLLFKDYHNLAGNSLKAVLLM